MYARRFKCKSNRWGSLFQPYVSLVRSSRREFSHSLLCASQITLFRDQYLRGSLIRRYVPSVATQINGIGELNRCWTCNGVRLYSSKGDGASEEDKHVPVNAKDAVNYDNGKTVQEKVRADVSSSDPHARLGEEDQRQWLKNEKLSIENKKKDSDFLSKRERFKNEVLRRVMPWEDITVSWESFPYYIHDHTKKLLIECVASHLKHKKFTSSYGARLNSSSGRILLQGIPGGELYRERLVRALARDLQVPLLVLDSSILAPYDFSEDLTSESEQDEDHVESGDDCSEDDEVDDENDASNEQDSSSNNEVKSGSEDDEDTDLQASADALRKLILPIKLAGESHPKESESTSETVKPEANQSPKQSKRALRKGDRVKYIGPPTQVESNKRIILGRIRTCDGSTNAYTSLRARLLPKGQRGEVYEVCGDQVAVVLDNNEEKSKGKTDGKISEEAAKPSLCWIPVQNIEIDLDAQAEDWYIAMEALSEVLPSLEPLIVYFPDSCQWLSRAVPKSNRKEFVRRVEEMFNRLTGPVVLICGQNKVETGSKEKGKFTMILPNFGRFANKLPLSLERLTEGLKGTKRSEDNELYKLFTNVVSIHPPKEEELLRTFNKQVEEDSRIVISRSNLNELQKVLEEHELSCMELLHVNTDGTVLTKQKAEQVIGWAKNHYLSSCLVPSIHRERLNVPRESLEVAIQRLKEHEIMSLRPSQNLKSLAKDEYETNFISAVVPSGEIGVKFDDIGALEEVKRTLNELVTLPMRRPELFSHGNLLRPCKGILLFGPPGTGKTLLAKALATEAGANFISVTGSTLTSKWFGDAEKLTKALFSFASKLAPVIIFVDEIDSLLGARGGAFEHEATRRMKNEFMAAWDGLRSKDSQRILILGATNRPFDLDDAVIRRLPRRIYVDLPDADNRMKILRIFLAKENLEPEFKYNKLANVTEGYSGSDLKNLCIAAAYRPVQELLAEENKVGTENVSSVLRQLNLDDFIQAKTKVGASIAYEATSMNELRKWNDQYGEGGSRKTSPFGFGN